MPALPNARHERFAQELAKGKTADEAYQDAGYKANRGNAATLKANQSVADRIAEIQSRAATRAEITVASITERLLAIATRAEGKDEASMLSVARASLMDAAKLNGLAPEKLNIDGRLDGNHTHTVESAGLQEALGWIAGALGERGEASD